MRNNDNNTLFYFAGHGLETEDGRVTILLEDTEFGLGGGISIDSLIDAMGSSPAGLMAKTQLYFFDCCRELWPGIVSPQWRPLSAGLPPDRYTFFATSRRASAYATSGETRFSRALLNCLEGEAAICRYVDGVKRLCVTTSSLWRCLWKNVPDIVRPPHWKVPQHPEIIDERGEAIICFLDRTSRAPNPGPEPP